MLTDERRWSGLHLASHLLFILLTVSSAKFVYFQIIRFLIFLLNELIAYPAPYDQPPKKDISREKQTQYAFHIICLLLPWLRELRQEQMEEKKLEAKIRGMTFCVQWHDLDYVQCPNHWPFLSSCGITPTYQWTTAASRMQHQHVPWRNLKQLDIKHMTISFQI